ncbi:MAG: purine-nucleoside phosphorylase [Calditrichia bacterium]
MAPSDSAIKKNVRESIKYIRKSISLEPKIAVILGSGLGDFADSLEDKIKIATADIPHYPKSTVEGHRGFLVFGKLNGLSVMAVQGRTHYYEGHSIPEVAYVVRIMAEIGIKTLLVTNAAGGVNPLFKPGDLMIIDDHINFMFRNPLRGPVIEPETRWTDMYQAYDRKCIQTIEEIGLALGIPLRKGVLFASTGPTYETASEVKMAQKMGGDAVSMSTVPEVLIARSRGIKVAGISCITNMATGISKTALSHREVTEIANQVKDKFQKLIREILIKLGNAA